MMTGETPQPKERDVLDDLREWVGRGAVPLAVAKRALAELERWRGLGGAVTGGPTFDEIRRSLRAQAAVDSKA